MLYYLVLLFVGPNLPPHVCCANNVIECSENKLNRRQATLQHFIFYKNLNVVQLLHSLGRFSCQTNICSFTNVTIFLCCHLWNIRQDNIVSDYTLETAVHTFIFYQIKNSLNGLSKFYIWVLMQTLL